MKGVPMQRRFFITLLGGASAAWPLAAGAQQRPTIPVIGYLSSETSGSYADQAFHQGLSQAGYVEGRNVSIEYYWSDYQSNRLPALAAEFVRRERAGGDAESVHCFCVSGVGCRVSGVGCRESKTKC